jgi:hypothetical protein
VVERATRRRPTGVGDEDVDGAEGLDDLERQAGQPLQVGGVGDEGAGPPADLGDGLVQPLPRAAGQGDPSAFPRQRSGHAPPDSLAGAHHQGDFSFETQIHPRTLTSARMPRTPCAGIVPCERP